MCDDIDYTPDEELFVKFMENGLENECHLICHKIGMWRVKDLYEVDAEMVKEVNWDGKLKVEAEIRLLKLINGYMTEDDQLQHNIIAALPWFDCEEN